MAEWYMEWFDTAYYHILYKHRDDNEALKFVSNLKSELSLPTGSTIVDLACGKGRHSKMFNDLGFKVLGLDLSARSIHEAKSLENESLHFLVHDMREPIESISVDVVVNLFTSFGYFEKVDDNSKVLRSVKSYLKSDGLLVIDFMNSKKVIDNLVQHESKSIQNITFNLSRFYDGRFIRKNIQVLDGEKNLTFEEKVQAFTKDELLNLLAEEGYKVEKVFGDYLLQPFDEQTSDRLIILARN
ncbi:MAG: class I SAM-dependent methyltransferase [Crocinitomicaceae bacterium]|nr:class I SAM-dependent methyltransferase [Crocinitomicaceae bacterium]